MNERIAKAVRDLQSAKAVAAARLVEAQEASTKARAARDAQQEADRAVEAARNLLLQVAEGVGEAAP